MMAGHETSGPIAPAVRKQRAVSDSAQFTPAFVFSLGPQWVSWVLPMNESSHLNELSLETPSQIHSEFVLSLGDVRVRQAGH